MKKRILSIVLSLLCLGVVVAFSGCREEDTRQHVSLLVYDERASETYLCELTEENPRHTLRVLYRPEGWDFHVKVKVPNVGIIDDPSYEDGVHHYENSVHREFDSYTSPEGEVSYNWTTVLSKGVYRYSFSIWDDNKRFHPFIADLTVEVI